MKTASITAKRSTAARTAAAEPIVSGLGETVADLKKLSGEKAKALLVFVKQGPKANLNETLEAAYQYGIVERRLRRLERRTKKAGSAKDEE